MLNAYQTSGASPTRTAMQDKFPGNDFSSYFDFLESLPELEKGETHSHHILPKAEFPEHSTHKWNLINLTYEDHLWAHYYLALCAPECLPFQTAFFLCSNTWAKDVNTECMPRYAEVYSQAAAVNKELARARSADPEVKAALIARNADPKVKASLAEFNSDPEVKAALIARTKALHADPEFAAAHSERMKVRRSEPEFAAACAARIKEQNADPEFQRKLHEARWADPESRVAQSQRTKRMHADPEFASAISERAKKMWEDPEFRAAKISQTKRLWEDPEFKAAHVERLKARNADPKFKAASSERTRAMNATPEWKAAQSGRSKKHIKEQNHTRWHTKRGLVNPKCALCTAEVQSVAQQPHLEA